MARNLTEETLARKVKVIKKAEDYQNTLERFEKRKNEQKAEQEKANRENAKKAKEERDAKKAAALKAREGKYQPFANLAELLKK